MRMRSTFITMATVTSFTVWMSCSLTPKAAGYNFLDTFSSASILPSREVKPEPVGKPVLISPDFAVGGESRRAMITLARAKIVFHVGTLEKESRLRFSAGTNSILGGGPPGTVEADGQPEVVYRRYVDPIDRPDAGKWFEESLRLSKVVGEKVMTGFGAGPGPNRNALPDWFAWADIELT